MPLLLWLMLGIAPVEESAKDGVQITYIANEGVLVRGGGKTILIDGLHRLGNPLYQRPPTELLQALESATSPYDGIDFLVASHVHADHFDPISTARHLDHNSKALFFGTPQTVAALKTVAGVRAPAPQRLLAVMPKKGEWTPLLISGIKAEALHLAHGGRFKDIENLGFILTIAGKRLLHIGDADTAVSNFSPYRERLRQVDLAFIPYWYLLYDEGRRVVDEIIQPRVILVVHLPPAEAETEGRKILARYPNAVIFSEPLQTWEAP